MKTPVSRIVPGKVILYRGEPCIVLEHRKEGTLLAVAEQIEQSFGKTNNFKDEDNALRVHLNGAFLDSITQGHPEEVITRTVDLTALNGSKEYGTVECKVAPLTLDELRKYHGILPNPESWEWSVTPWSTPCVDDDHAWNLISDGNLYYSYCSNTYGSLACTPMASSTATAAPTPSGPAPLSSFPPILRWRMTATRWRGTATGSS